MCQPGSPPAPGHPRPGSDTAFSAAETQQQAAQRGHLLRADLRAGDHLARLPRRDGFIAGLARRGQRCPGPLPARAQERQREDGELKGGMDVHAAEVERNVDHLRVPPTDPWSGDHTTSVLASRPGIVSKVAD
jgi:hypothetical protein